MRGRGFELSGRRHLPVAPLVTLRFVILCAGIVLASKAMAESVSSDPHPCPQSASVVESVLCSSADLVRLSQKAAALYEDALKSHPDSHSFLSDTHREWLEDRAQRCSGYDEDEWPSAEELPAYQHCLTRHYEDRIALLSAPELWPPFDEVKVDAAIARLRTMGPEDIYRITVDANRDALQELSCRFFEKDPVAASHSFAAYFGSTMDAFNPLCNRIDIAERVPEVRILLDALAPVWGSASECMGTMRFAHYRMMSVLRIMAAVDARPDQAAAVYTPLDSAALGYTPDLKHWSQQGNWEKRQYEALQPVIRQAQAALGQYYRSRFHVSPEQARIAAEHYTTQLVRSQSENSGASSTLSYMSLCYDTDDLDAYLKTHNLPDKQCPYGRFSDESDEAVLRRFLGLAIVNRYPLEVVRGLLADGAELEPKPANIHSYGSLDDTPLMLAAPHPEVMTLLLKAGAAVNRKNNFGKTALMYAIQERNTETVAMLLAAGADVNAQTDADVLCTALKAGSRTPLMYAAWQSSPEIIRLLVTGSADKAAKDSNGDTALTYLERNDTLSAEQKKELVELLRTAR